MVMLPYILVHCLEHVDIVVLERESPCVEKKTWLIMVQEKPYTVMELLLTGIPLRHTQGYRPLM